MGKKRRKNREKEKTESGAGWRERVLKALAQQKNQPISASQLIRKIGLKKKDDIRKASHLIDKLIKERPDRQTDDGVPAAGGKRQLEGTVDHVSSRFCYVVLGEEEPDIFVRAADMGTAFHGDTVRVTFRHGRHGEKPEGRIVEILKRKRTQFVGKIQLSARYAFVTPDFRKIHQDFFIHPENVHGARDRDKVIVEIIDWGTAGKNPEARVVEILGKAGENEAEIHSIMAEFELPFRFAEQVIEASNKIAGDITNEEIGRRMDFRAVTTFTIDPEDAKDFDDALSIRELPNGNLEIGVHIADVSHYVAANSILDKEAYGRGTSVYLVDRTVPMLPERLSNELCSLRPHEDKLTFAAVFQLDHDRRVVSEWFGKTVIHSDRRFTYEEAQRCIETGQGDFARELVTLNTLARKLREDRFIHGAVNFETTEVKFRLDETGRPLDIIPKIRKDAHKMIEEYMLLANRQVARYVFNQRKGRERNTFVYRTHDFPDPDKIREFAQFARQFGYRLDSDTQNISKSLNRLMTDIEGKPEQNVLEQIAIRSMAKAIYTTDAKGHFGLGFDHYTHFTSPIRRYPDVMVHRLLAHYLQDGRTVNKSIYEMQCNRASELEKRAADAERASIKYKQVEFMTYAENKLYEGLISGVTEWGVYVEIIETKCEGMVRISDIGDDYYRFEPGKFRIVGRRGRVLTLGDQVRVRVKKTDIDRRLIDLIFADR